MFVTFGEPVLRLAAPSTERLATARQLRTSTAGAESVAAAAARPFEESHYCTVLPDSPLGQRVAGELRERDVNVHATRREGRIALEFAEPGSPPRPPSRVSDRAATAASGISEGDLPQETVAKADAVYTTGVTAGGSAELARATARFCKTASDGDATTALGLHYRPAQWPAEEAREALSSMFPAVDVLITTEEDAAHVLDREGPSPEVAHALAATHGFDAVALVRDRNAVVLHDSTVYDYEFPTDGDARDRVDPFAGAFLASLDGDPDSATRRGVATAALADEGLPVLDAKSVATLADELD